MSFAWVVPTILSLDLSKDRKQRCLANLRQSDNARLHECGTCLSENLRGMQSFILTEDRRMQLSFATLACPAVIAVYQLRELRSRLTPQGARCSRDRRRFDGGDRKPHGRHPAEAELEWTLRHLL